MNDKGRKDGHSSKADPSLRCNASFLVASSVSVGARQKNRQTDRNEQSPLLLLFLPPSFSLLPRNNRCFEFQMQKSSLANFPRRDCGCAHARRLLCGLQAAARRLRCPSSVMQMRPWPAMRLVEGRKEGSSSGDGAAQGFHIKSQGKEPTNRPQRGRDN